MKILYERLEKEKGELNTLQQRYFYLICASGVVAKMAYDMENQDSLFLSLALLWWSTLMRGRVMKEIENIKKRIERIENGNHLKK